MSDLTASTPIGPWCPECGAIDGLTEKDCSCVNDAFELYVQVDGPYADLAGFGRFGRDEVLLALWGRWGAAVRGVRIWADSVEVTFTGESWALVPNEQIARMVANG